MEVPIPKTEVAAFQPISSLHENAKFLQDLATRIWRAQKQLDKALSNSDEVQLERFARRFEEISETLSDYGVEILDHTGQNYDVGLNLTVLQFEPTPGIARETICETIKPSLRMHGVLVPGQVIVAAPVASRAENVETVAEEAEPTAENIEPTTENVQSVAENVEPTTENAQPVTENVEPVAEIVEPPADNAEPEAKNAERGEKL